MWLILLILAVFLPRKLAESSGDERTVFSETNRDLSAKSISKRDDSNSATSTVLGESSEKVLTPVKKHSKEELPTKQLKSVTRSKLSKMSKIFCLYYLLCLSLFACMVISFYTPLLMKYHLGLGLSYVKLTYINSSLFVFVLFFATTLFLEKISEQDFLFTSISALAVPISITFYFGLFWNSTMGNVNESYLLACSILLSSAQFLNIPVAASLLSKITPVVDAAFYQSFLYTAIHLGICLSRVVAGATFGKIPIMYSCAVLTVSWLTGMIWLGYEYSNFARVNLK